MEHGIPVLSRHVLVLNRLWQPVHICTVRRAVAILYRGLAHVVDGDDGAFSTCTMPEWIGRKGGNGAPAVRSVSCSVPAPEIILLSHYDRVPAREVKLTRKNVYLRDGNTCQYCGRAFRESELNIDHVVPRRLGGPTTWVNVVCSCVRCNLRKGEKTPEASGMRLIRSPKKPRWTPFNHIAFRRDLFGSWDHFLSPADWKVQLVDSLS